MEQKHQKHHSPDDFEEHRKKKPHKRHHGESSSSEEEEDDSNRRKHHKHKRSKERKHKQRSGSQEESREVMNGSHHSRNHIGDHNRDSSKRDHRQNRHSSADRQIESRGHSSRHHRHRSGRSSAEFDPSIRIKQEKDDHNFQEQQRERHSYNQRRRDARRERDRAGGDHGLNTDAPIVKSEPGEGNPENTAGKENTDGDAAERQQPNFELSGKLTEDTNTFRGVVIKYNEPPEAMKPKRRWRLYPFKGQESLPVLHIHRQSAFLLGRDRRIADIPVDHPSCSKQQAVLQFRAMPYTRPDGTPGRRVRPYIIDLESANGTYLNGEKVDARRYYELKEKDVIKFGFSSREYVVLHDAVDVSEVAAGEDMEEA